MQTNSKTQISATRANKAQIRASSQKCVQTIQNSTKKFKKLTQHKSVQKRPKSTTACKKENNTNLDTMEIWAFVVS